MLVTRPEPGAQMTAARLAALGFRPVCAPLVRIAALPSRLPAAEAIQAILVASSAAVAALPATLHEVPLLAVGDATATAGRAAGFARVESAGADAAALAGLAAGRCDPAAGPLLLACGRGQGERLAAELRARGFQVLRRTVYAARPVPELPEPARQALARHELLAALFFSAETARVFAALVTAAGLAGALGGVEAMAIGAAAGDALRGLPWRRVRVAVRPTQDSVLALLQ